MIRPNKLKCETGFDTSPFTKNNADFVRLIKSKKMFIAHNANVK